MDKIEFSNIDMKTSGDKITAASVNVIQSGLDEIKNLWGLENAGYDVAVVGDICRASLINNWVSWLKSYSSRIGATSLTDNISGVNVGDIMAYSKINEIYGATQSVKNYCNRSECNKSECNRSECNKRECNNGESNAARESNTGEGKFFETNFWIGDVID